MPQSLNDTDRVTKLLNEHKITLYMLTEDNMALIDAEYILRKRDKFSETFNMFADDLSRQTMLAYLRTKLTGNPLHCAAVYRPGKCFNDLTATARGGIFVDCGAYRGDTIERFINWSGGHYKKIFGFEPDAENFVALENFVRERGYKNVTLLNCGVYDRKAVLAFDSCGNESSALSTGGTVSTAVEKIDDVVSDEVVNLIKVSFLGNELAALKGAALTIKRDKPALTVGVWVSSADLITLPQYIKSLYGGYKFYLRKHTFTTEWDFVIYATP